MHELWHVLYHQFINATNGNNEMWSQIQTINLPIISQQHYDSYLNSMSFHFSIYKMGIIKVSKSQRVNVKIKWDDI